MSARIRFNLSETTPYQKNNQYTTFGVALLFIFLLYKYIHGEDSYIRIHDYGEAYLPLFKAMSLTDLFGFKEMFEPFLGSIRRNALGSEFNIGNLIHTVLPPLTAVILNEAIMRVVAFLGMYLFLEENVRLRWPFLSFTVALTYSLLPFFPPIYLTIAGLPLVTWALCKITRGDALYKEYIICLLFPLYIAFQGIPGVLLFIVTLVGSYWLVERQFSKRVLLIIVGMVVILFISEWRLIALSFFDQDFIGHRTENIRSYLNPEHPNYFGLLFKRLMVGISRDEIMHSPTYHLTLVLPFSILASFLALIDVRANEKTQKLKRWIILLLAIFCISLIARALAMLLQPYFPLFREFNLDRIRWMYPPLFYILFAISVCYFQKRFNNWVIQSILVTGVIFNGINMVITSNDPQHFKLGTYNKMTYSDFFAEPIFNDIRNYLQNEKVDRVVSVGINPGVALFNGFRTADGYWMQYDLRYKHLFRHVIADELEKNKRLERYYDNWGSRVHMFYGEQGPRTWRKPKKDVSKRFDYNTEALKKLNVSHVFSAIKVANSKELNWKHENTFCNKEIPYCVHLYSL